MAQHAKCVKISTIRKFHTIQYLFRGRDGHLHVGGGAAPALPHLSLQNKIMNEVYNTICTR